MDNIEELKAFYASLSQQLHYGPSLAPLWEKIIKCLDELSVRVDKLDPTKVEEPKSDPVAVFVESESTDNPATDLHL